jgi:hypothetical protein
VVVGRGIEEHARPAEILVLDEVGHRDVRTRRRVGPQHVRQVPDPHVVRDDGEVVAAEPLACRRQVAHGAGERLLGLEAGVHRAALGAQRLRARVVAAALRTGDPNRQRAASLEVDVHPEEVLRGLGEDLRETGGGDRVVARDHVRAAAALEEHDRLDEVGVEPGVLDGFLDERPERIGALRGREDAARALGVQRVGEPEGCALLELRVLGGVVRKHVLGRHRVARHEGGRGLVAVTGPEDEEHRERGEHHQRRARGQAPAARLPAAGVGRPVTSGRVDGANACTRASGRAAKAASYKLSRAGLLVLPRPARVSRPGRPCK